MLTASFSLQLPSTLNLGACIVFIPDSHIPLFFLLTLVLINYICLNESLAWICMVTFLETVCDRWGLVQDLIWKFGRFGWLNPNGLWAAHRRMWTGAVWRHQNQNQLYWLSMWTHARNLSWSGVFFSLIRIYTSTYKFYNVCIFLFSVMTPPPDGSWINQLPCLTCLYDTLLRLWRWADLINGYPQHPSMRRFAEMFVHLRNSSFTSCNK